MTLLKIKNLNKYNETHFYGDGMKKLIVLTSLIIILSASIATAETSTVIVKRAGDNLYKTNTGLYIETKDCMEKVVENKAVLKYEKNSDNNEIIFENGSKCTVVIVFKI